VTGQVRMPSPGPGLPHPHKGRQHMEMVIVVLGQLALALSGGVLVVALLWVILSILAAVIRRVQDLSR
jgi:hypothetical protein